MCPFNKCLFFCKGDRKLKIPAKEHCSVYLSSSGNIEKGNKLVQQKVELVKLEGLAS
jgi:hypothetical protein